MMRNIFLFIIFVLLFAGCAPEYMVKNIYIPPVGNKAKVCIDGCQRKRDICQSKCDAQYNQCLNSAFNRAKDIKAVEDVNYNKRYKRYLEKLRNYHQNMFDWQNYYDQDYKDWRYFKNGCKANHNTYACKREIDLRYAIRNLLTNKPQEPKMPYKKSFDEIVKNEQRFCQKDCSCQKDYDICFLNCGGEIQMKKICVSNCDK